MWSLRLKWLKNKAYSSFCRVIFSGRYSIAQIAGWIILFYICLIQVKFVSLPRSLKRSGALLGSNSMRNKIAQNDKHGQESLMMGLLFFHA